MKEQPGGHGVRGGCGPRATPLDFDAATARPGADGRVCHSLGPSVRKGSHARWLGRGVRRAGGQPTL